MQAQSRATAAMVEMKNSMNAALKPAGRLYPKEIATEIVPGPVVSGIVRG